MVTEQLIWHLNGIVYKEKAVNFLKRFEESLCVFSGSVQQIYANYNIWPVTADSSTLLVLPNPNAHHDVFQSVNDDAVVKTSLFILPGEAVGKRGMYLGQKDKKTGKVKLVSLAKGLQSIASRMPANDPFLPLITNKGLREMNRTSPILRLHRLKVDKLDAYSDYETGIIRNTIVDKMNLHLIGR